ncbi:MAG: hypothetical protein M3Y84_01435, partial [Acidobacteriota bacterium]|nr:hypothetical protein [Acidobacteriota bacterium]
WIEERKDIDAELEKAQTKLSRAWELFGKGANDDINFAWERSLGEFRETVADLNKRIRIFNLKAPAAVFHRRHIDVDKVIEKIICNSNC